MNARLVWTLALATGLLFVPAAAAQGERPETPADEPRTSGAKDVAVGEELSGPPDPGSSCRPYC